MVMAHWQMHTHNAFQCTLSLVKIRPLLSQQFRWTHVISPSPHQSVHFRPMWYFILMPLSADTDDVSDVMHAVWEVGPPASGSVVTKTGILSQTRELHLTFHHHKDEEIMTNYLWVNFNKQKLAKKSKTIRKFPYSRCINIKVCWINFEA